MKIICKQQQLNEAVLNIQRAVSAKSSVPALEGILLSAEESEITLCGYDLELGMKTKIEAKVEEKGRIVLSARLFGDIVRRLPADDVHLSVDDKNITKIQSGPADFSIAGIPAEEYPELPSITGETSIKIANCTLKSMIRQTIFAVAESDAKPIHTGTLFELDKNKIRLVSVDGYRLALREETAKCEEELNFVVPGKTLQEVMKLLSDDDEELEILIGRRHILFQIGSYCVISRLLEGEFLDYRAAIPNTSAMEILVSTRSFIESVERVSLIITDRLKSPVRCLFEDNEIKVSCSTSIGRASDQLPAKMEGEPVEMGFNNRYLLDALRNTEGDEMKIQLNGALSPMKILPREGNSYLFLVLPVRLKSEA
ncbi:DNA polymerase III subunit beta [Caproiciproducens galactitolivorans]|uniref:Beta sliding clamp n=1 Tax=Caproiciproducens galactitolivorans TaxID=642589 RepID=A0A4Z0YDA6_9FIRM|nr:DNA polymerase III subunit beta [Caproiciproducens galactitolivorans]QEY35200.1 DNA polymerase III subunit beta [Caproiciproducens galactitolivorans]TGJ76890.1 DNA polymerase III subunit beta [Caproiciproducens galactitolivorans]